MHVMMSLPWPGPARPKTAKSPKRIFSSDSSTFCCWCGGKVHSQCTSPGRHPSSLPSSTSQTPTFSQLLGGRISSVPIKDQGGQQEGVCCPAAHPKSQKFRTSHPFTIPHIESKEIYIFQIPNHTLKKVTHNTTSQPSHDLVKTRSLARIALPTLLQKLIDFRITFPKRTRHRRPPIITRRIG